MLLHVAYDVNISKGYRTNQADFPRTMWVENWISNERMQKIGWFSIHWKSETPTWKMVSKWCLSGQRKSTQRWSPPWTPFEIWGGSAHFWGPVCLYTVLYIYRCLHETTMSMYSTNIDAHSLSLYSSLFLMYIYSNPPKVIAKKQLSLF
jgi:hypothetical protein